MKEKEGYKKNKRFGIRELKKINKFGFSKNSSGDRVALVP